MSSPTADIKITSLGKNSKLKDKAIASVKMLGSKEKLVWNQQSDAQVIEKSLKLPEWKVIAFEIKFEK